MTALPIPTTIDALHYCALLSIPSLPESDCQQEVAAALALLNKKSGLNGYKLGLHTSGDAVSNCMRSTLKSVYADTLLAHSVVSTLYLDQALPHTDSFFGDVAFLSYVLRAPAEGVLFGVVSQADGEVDRTVLTLKTGDWFVFKPTDIHFLMGMPGASDSKVVLAQVTLKDRTKEDRIALAKLNLFRS